MRPRLRNFAFLLLILAVTPLCRAQANKTESSAKPGVTVADVVKMSKAGLSDDIIIDQIRKKNVASDLSPDELIELKTSGVSDRVIQFLVNPAKGESPAGSAADARAAASATPAVADSGMPNEIGVYAKKQGQWTEVLPEVVNWKTGGVLKSIGSAGIVKGDVNGHLVGPSSRNSLASPLEFLIIAPEGVAITEYQLLRLRKNADNREFRMATGGVMHVSSGATRDVVPFEGKKLSKGVFSVVLPANLGAGEYGFLPPGAVGAANAAGSSGKIYSFRVME